MDPLDMQMQDFLYGLGELASEGGVGTGRHLLSARVLGVGPGVFTLCFFGIFCFLLCLLGRSAGKASGTIITLSTFIFGIVCIVLFTSPRGDKDESTVPGNDHAVIYRNIMLIVMILAVILSLMGLAIFHLQPPKYGRALVHQIDVMRH